MQLMYQKNLKLLANLAIENLFPQLCIPGLTCNEARDSRFTVIRHVNVGIRGRLPVMFVKSINQYCGYEQPIPLLVGGFNPSE